MDFQYMAYNRKQELIKGKVSASSEAAALDLLNYAGLRALSLKEANPFISIGVKKFTSAFSRINPKEIVMFSRQLALLIESGVDIAASFDLLQEQIPNRSLKRILLDVSNDIRTGTKLSQAMEKHPKAFSPFYCRTISIAEQTGNLELALRQMADYIEKGNVSAKKVQNAFVYPVIVFVLAIVVIAVLITFVLPAFADFYDALGTDLPTVTLVLMAIVDFLLSYGLIMLAVIVGVAVVGYVYTRTSTGRYQWDRIMLGMPMWGRIIILSELSLCCRNIAVLFRAGVPLPDIMTLVISNTKNRVVSRALTEVREEMLGGQGLARPMSQRPIFLPLMVQMTAVGESTGNLDNTLDTVAQSYEMEATDRTDSLIAAIQPTMTIVMGAIVGFIAVSLIATMYSITGSVGV